MCPIGIHEDLDREIQVFGAKEDKSISVDEALRMYLKAKNSHG